MVKWWAHLAPTIVLWDNDNKMLENHCLIFELNIDSNVGFICGQMWLLVTIMTC
jgi:hypothetical protein